MAMPNFVEPPVEAAPASSPCAWGLGLVGLMAMNGARGQRIGSEELLQADRRIIRMHSTPKP